MNVHVRDARDFFVSLRLTLALLALSIVLVFAATLDQVNIGIWPAQEKYFRTFVVYTQLGGVAIPVFPGGYTLGGLLLINLIAAHVFRFQWAGRKVGLWLTHVGLIVLLLGELFSGLLQEDYHLRLDQEQTRSYAESYRLNELVIVDRTDPEFDTVVAIPEARLAEKAAIAHPQLPFRILPTTYYPNALLQVRPASTGEPPVPAAGPPSVAMPRATAGLGPQLLAIPQPLTFKEDERNLPVAFLEFQGADGSLGTYLVSMQILQPQEFEHAGRTWRIALRPKRAYYPFAVTLLKFSHDRYPGTEIPRNFSSELRITDPAAGDDRQVLISMNNPLRYAGLTFYQAGFENNDRTTVLQVVRNPSWLLPYIACGLMSLGLLMQFGMHLVGFVRWRVRGSCTTADKGGARTGPSPRRPLAWVLGSVAVAALLGAATTRRTTDNPTAFDTAGFAELPTLVNGRLKPLDTVARTSLLLLQGRQRVAAPDGRVVSPAEWLLDVLYRPDVADAYPVFEVVHPDVLAAVGLAPADGAGGKRFSLQQLRPRLRELDRQARLAQETEAQVRTPYQRAAIKLRDAVLIYQKLQSSANALGMTDFFGRVLALPTAVEAETEAGRELGTAFRAMDSFGSLRLVPPRDPAADPEAWATVGAAWSEKLATPADELRGRSWAELGQAWQAQDAAAFNRAVSEYRAQLDAARAETMRRARVETRFNAAEPFYVAGLLFLGGFLFAVGSWLKWPVALRRLAVGCVAVAFVLTTAGIVARMWLESRPPVTNLYSSALFVGWVAVGLCLALESIHRHAIAAAAAGALGFAALLIAHHLALGGDTLEMMRAVLDSNFWLATHVVTVTIGYAATFLAGFLGLVYVVRGVFTRTLDAETSDVLGRMIYGIVCFATLFSFVGTVLGGIWADQSWGRFWGWDPKENGALLIVMWNALILHARWAGLVRQRGLATLAIFGNIVTAWSWFGVNMLGIGLHSYGFMDAAFWWLVSFAVSQLVMIAIGSLPIAVWRSFGLMSAAKISPSPLPVNARG